MRHTRAHYIVFLVCGCTPGYLTPTPDDTVHEAEPSAAATDEVVPAHPADVELELFLEPVDLPEAVGNTTRASEFVGGYVLLRASGSERRLLDARTLEVREFPKLAGEPAGKLQLYWEATKNVAYAHIETKAENRLHQYQVLRFDPLRWEEAGEFEHPPLAEGFGGPDDIAPTVKTILLDGLVVTIDDGRGSKKRYRLDHDTLVWAEIESTPTCQMRCLGLEEDLVRWGVAPDSDDSTCVAVRASSDDEWTRLPDLPGMMRSCRRIDDDTVLAVGGLESLVPFPKPMTEAHLVKLSEPGIELLGNPPALGSPLTPPGDDLVWLKEGSLVRFDPEKRTFTEEAAPKPEWDVLWRVRLDSQTLLIGGTTKEGKAVAARLGFRQKSRAAK